METREEIKVLLYQLTEEQAEWVLTFLKALLR